MKQNNGRQAVGKEGEDAALEYLLQHGLSLMERNWRSHHLEIDLIMAGKDGIHIVEVRTRHVPSPVMPEQTVNLLKQRRVEKAAASYVAARRINADIHFDIVAVQIGTGGIDVEHIPDAFYPIR